MCGVHGRREGGGAHPVLPPVSRPPAWGPSLRLFSPEGVFSVAGACLSYPYGAQVACMAVGMACASSLVCAPPGGSVSFTRVCATASR